MTTWFHVPPGESTAYYVIGYHGYVRLSPDSITIKGDILCNASVDPNEVAKNPYAGIQIGIIIDGFAGRSVKQLMIDFPSSIAYRKTTSHHPPPAQVGYYLPGNKHYAKPLPLP